MWACKAVWQEVPSPTPPQDPWTVLIRLLLLCWAFLYLISTCSRHSLLQSLEQTSFPPSPCRGFLLLSILAGGLLCFLNMIGEVGHGLAGALHSHQCLLLFFQTQKAESLPGTRDFKSLLRTSSTIPLGQANKNSKEKRIWHLQPACIEYSSTLWTNVTIIGLIKKAKGQ